MESKDLRLKKNWRNFHKISLANLKKYIGIKVVSCISPTYLTIFQVLFLGTTSSALINIMKVLTGMKQKQHEAVRS